MIIGDHNNTTVIEKARFLKNKLWPEFEPNGPGLSPKKVFCHFVKFGSYFSLKIAYNDSLRHCLTFSSGRIYEKNFWVQVWGKRVKIGPEIRFFAIFSSLVYQFSCKLHKMIAWNNVQLLYIYIYIYIKWRPWFGPNGPKSGLK